MSGAGVGTVTVDAVHQALASVPDPEMPPISVAELGMVVAVRVDGGEVEVDLVPTFSGCPATELIRTDVQQAVEAVDGVETVRVRFVGDVVWDPERISQSGREKLREFGIAPPGSGQTLLQISRVGASVEPGVTCPFCGSHETATTSPFGPTPCRASSYCSACRNPFETMKP